MAEDERRDLDHELNELNADLRVAPVIGNALADPVPHLHRAVAILNQAERRRMVDYLYQTFGCFETNPPPKPEFVASTLEVFYIGQAQNGDDDSQTSIAHEITSPFLIWQESVPHLGSNVSVI